MENQVTEIKMPKKLMEMLQKVTDDAEQQIKLVQEQAMQQVNIMINSFLSDKEYPPNSVMRVEGESLIFIVKDDNTNHSGVALPNNPSA